jgi:hypothetical protein
LPSTRLPRERPETVTTKRKQAAAVAAVDALLLLLQKMPKMIDEAKEITGALSLQTMRSGLSLVVAENAATDVAFHASVHTEQVKLVKGRAA